MYLVISKKFEISLSYRYSYPEWPEAKNREVFGPKHGTPHGFGGNFNVFVIFAGPVDEKTGMLINVTTIKERVGKILADRYDHKFLNRDTPPFNLLVPTPERVAAAILADIAPLFDDAAASPVACHVETSPTDAATAYDDGRVERDWWFDFSAARRTYSPHLSDEENDALFGIAASQGGHGHHYRVRITLAGDIATETGMIFLEMRCAEYIDRLRLLLDHKNLTTDVNELQRLPLTTECLAQFIYRNLAKHLPVDRVRLWENPYFYAEYLGQNQALMGVKSGFNAAHRLHSPHLTDAENRDIYGKCNNPAGHGHYYTVETAIDGKLDDRSGTVFPLDKFLNGVRTATEPWDYKHLNADTTDFTDRPTTGENIIQVLWPRIEAALERPLYRLRLWETPNNRFTLRREGGGT